MKKQISLLLSLLMLAACSSAPANGPFTMVLQERMRNPLVAERYWSDMAEHMAEFTRRNDPILKDSIMAGVIEGERMRALERVQAARDLKAEGISGVFKTSTAGEDVLGEALLRGNVLSFGPAFLTLPGPAVHVYVSTIVDPRDGTFPDPTAIDLGLMQTAYGPQEYAVPDRSDLSGIRSAVLYDVTLKRIVAFAQLSK